MINLLSTLQNAVANSSVLLIPLAFVGGVLTTISPCVLAMLPVLIGYVGGSQSTSKRDVLCQTGLFIVGLSLTFAVIGVITAYAGATLGSLVPVQWYVVMGVVAILMGLSLLNVFHLPIPMLNKFPKLPQSKLLAPLFLGVAFGAAASPCGTPYLVLILSSIAAKQNMLLGGLALFAYALGQGLLLLLVGLFTGLLKHLATIRQVGMVVTKLSGAVFILAGLLLIGLAAGVIQ
ncbi:MAG: sulfite exporter TauE/SafE family protein [Cyanobacteria bacterium HKST-UBA06]|nr:sulfite exporter TauE/SafE family protein [Cyanobacteria bacterium HKST-UBA06]MCA9841022.1 sulfite exporter TauE/SafE family protein [Cyanobacteria bacterium HKST-UBA03]